MNFKEEQNNHHNQSIRILNSLIFACIFSVSLQAQTFIPGQSYFSEDEHIEYIHGNLPIILSSPHGGEKKPDEIPDRSCSGCVTINDTNTQELTREITDAIHQKTSCFPYVIINRLHRSKLDANREIIEAADGNNQAEAAWTFYHDHVTASRESISETHTKGLFLDIHGHGHEIQRLELGYLLSKSDLQEDNDFLDNESIIAKSSINHLVENNVGGFNHSELIRGENSFGHLIHQNGINAVPSLTDPFPMDDESYFTGGYNTRQYGSRDGGTIDGIQIECHQDVRFEDAPRKEFADSLALVIINYLERHYFPDGIDGFCNSLASANVDLPLISIYPNPVSDELLVTTDIKYNQLIIQNILGQKMHQSTGEQRKINVSLLQNGIYFCQFLNDGQLILTKSFIKL